MIHHYPNTTFIDFKNKLSDEQYLNYKEDDHLGMIYINNDNLDSKPLYNHGSLFIDKTTTPITPIVMHFEPIIYNDDCIKILRNLSSDEWNKQIIIQPCYEGTTILVFFHNNKWYVTTRRCLDSNESMWIKNKSYRQMFEESINFSLDDLNKDYCYYFVLIHYSNKNLVSYKDYDKLYKEVIHTMTMEKYTFKEVEYKINNLVKTQEIVKYNSLDHLLNRLDEISINDKKNHNVSTEGFIVKYYTSENTFIIMKLQTHLYQELAQLKPNNSNIYQSYLELYQKDQLRDFLPYVPYQCNKLEIIKRINNGMRNMATEILNLYHGTRKKKNSEVYNSLTEQYKRVLYGLHGIYINHRKNKVDENNKLTSITIHDVYFYIKNLPAEQLRQLFFERWELLKKACEFFNPTDMYIQVQTILMFKHLFDQNNEKLFDNLIGQNTESK
jgi:hypothetical protein